MNEDEETNSYDPRNDVEELYNIFHNQNSPPQKIIEIICNHTDIERQKLRYAYSQSYGSDLLKELQSKLSNDKNLNNLLQDLALSNIEYIVQKAHKSIEGPEKNDETLIEIVVSNNCEQLQSISQLHQQVYGESLEQAIIGEKSGVYQKLLVGFIQGKRNENPYPNVQKIKKTVDDLGSDNKLNKENFIKCFTTCGFGEICMICRLYENINNVSIFDIVKKEFGNDCNNLLKGMVDYICDNGKYFAKKINKFENSVVNRVLVSRSEVDMEEIRDAYKELYGKDLIEDIREHYDDDYKNALIILAKKK